MRRLVVLGVSLLLLAGCGAERPPGQSQAQTRAQAPAAETVAAYFSPPEAFPGPTWTKDGRAVDGQELNTIAGPEHCDWQSAVLMHLGWPLGTVSRTSAEIRQYIRDPDGVLDQVTRASFGAGVALPPDAEDTGYRHGRLELWLSPSEPDAAYVWAAGDVERWPRTEQIVACA